MLNKKTKRMEESGTRVVIPDIEAERKKFGAVERAFSARAERLIASMGVFVRLAGRFSAGRFLIAQSGRAAGALLAKKGFFNMEKSGSAPGVVSQWLKMLEAVGVRYEVGKTAEDEVEVFLLQCPFGLTEADGRAVCDAGMATDREVVRGLGGLLEIGETIATGADRCHLVVKIQ